MSRPLSHSAGALALACLLSFPARAEGLRPAFDPQLHIKPPMSKRLDGTSGPLLIDQDFRAAAARFRNQNPGLTFAEGDIAQVGEVLVLRGDQEILETDGSGWGVRSLSAAARKVIEKAGDNFQTITFWLTFQDRATPDAVAYEATIKNDVLGLGPSMSLRDLSRSYGSAGVLRSVVNMKTVGLRAGDRRETWLPHLETWGQESGHRWMAFFLVRDPRTQQNSDLLLGRDCAHYSRFVDTQASVHDGFAWRDNGNGTFTWTEQTKRYGNLDLYGMGLLNPDEVPPFFYIDDIPNYRHPGCGQAYDRAARPGAQTVSGTRVPLTIEDVIAANGPRVPSAEAVRQDYWREAQVVLTNPNETVDSPTVRALANRINNARLFWEDWNREATGNRLVICTKVSSDCGDPRSDVMSVAFGPSADGTPPKAATMEVRNTGGRATTGVKAILEVVTNGEVKQRLSKDVGTLEPGASVPVSFTVDLRGLACGSELQLRGLTESDYHRHRRRSTVLFGTETRVSDGFEKESGWTINPDGDDSSTGAIWERGRPEATVLLKSEVQPGGAYAGEGAWVTGLLADGRNSLPGFVREGKTTLQSPLYATAGLSNPRVRYWVSFAGVRAGSTSDNVEPSPDSRLVVFARAADLDGAGTAGEWKEIDRLENQITRGWVQRLASLPVEALGRSGVQLRFVATDGNVAQGGVEVALDDLEIISNLSNCVQTAGPGMMMGDGGCGCRLDGRPSGGSALWLLALAPWLWLRRRRRV